MFDRELVLEELQRIEETLLHIIDRTQKIAIIKNSIPPLLEIIKQMKRDF
jgi:hypothetical protein